MRLLRPGTLLLQLTVNLVALVLDIAARLVRFGLGGVTQRPVLVVLVDIVRLLLGIGCCRIRCRLHLLARVACLFGDFVLLGLLFGVVLGLVDLLGKADFV